MLDIPDTKPFIESLFRPAARRLARAKFTANGVTVAGMALSLATGACALAACPLKLPPRDVSCPLRLPPRLPAPRLKLVLPEWKLLRLTIVLLCEIYVLWL